MSVKHSHKKRKDFPFLMTMVKLMKGISQEKKKRWIDFLERSYFWNDMQLSHCVDNNITHILPSGSQNKAKLSYCMRQPSVGVFINTCFENMQQIYRRKPMPKRNFNKVANQVYWNNPSAWVFSCKFAVCFQNTFIQEHLWGLLLEVNMV